MHNTMILLIMVKNIPIFNIFILTFLYYVIQTIDEVASDDIIKGGIITEVVNIRQYNEHKCWFIRSFNFLTPVIHIKWTAKKSYLKGLPSLHPRRK